ncbi:MAG: ribosome biogenesis GTPase Der [Gammaproteobacteria bacterium]|nr:ribosome biogenesis GTPase Der [Gammaproteobacteria bacterium]
MIPVIAIIGRPNVGKSTLFNCLTKSRDALVADLPGVTRDRKYGEGECESKRYIVIDTGGIESDVDSEMYQLMTQQTSQAISEADAILFVVDAKKGLTPNDQKIAETLRHTAKPIFLVANKSEGMDEEIAKSDFFQLGFDKVNAIASAHNRGIKKLLGEVLATFQVQEPASEDLAYSNAIKIAVIGRPNVGKSTLINRILGEDRVLVYDEPGTTRDSIFIPFDRYDKSYVLIDTAGVRRRTRITEEVEKFSVIKTLQTIEAANVVVFVLNAREGLSDQDLRLLDFIIDAGKALVVAVNKWDRMSIEDRNSVKSEINRRLEFVSFARMHFISALHGTGVGDLFKSIDEAYAAATKKLSTPLLTRILEHAIKQHQPPLVHGRRIKLRYAHAGGSNPPIIVIHGNQTEALPLDYSRYLIKFFRKRLKLVGTPLRLELKSGDNPFKDKKNILTPRQQQKKQRMLKYVKGKRH